MYCSEIRPYWLLVTKGYGFTVDDIDWSCPSDLEPYSKAYNLQLQHQDYQLYAMGMYALSAVSVAVEHNLAGKNAKSQYLKQPFLSGPMDHESKEISEEKRAEMDNYKLAMTLRIMQANFEINKERKGDSVELENS